MRKGKHGVQIMCPWCSPSHALNPAESSPCGTSLKLTAVQTILPARLVREKKLTCVKCRGNSGEMVPYMNGFIHIAECAPGTFLLRDQPSYSLLARMVYKTPTRIRKFLEKLTGPAKEVKEVDPSGSETGRIIGYFFLKTRGASHA
jgi:hypothetical protein